MKNVNTNLRPFSDIDPHDERPYYTLTESSGDKGMIVKYDGGLNLNSSISGNQRVNILDNSFYTADIAGVVSTRWSVPHTITAATSGTTRNQVAGILLNNVRETDENGEKLINHRKNADAREITLSGEAVSLAKKGFFMVSGVEGTVGAGSGAAVADEGNGKLKVIDANNTGNLPFLIGIFAGPVDNAGYAPLELGL